MYSYIMRRLAFGVVTVVGVSIIVFMVLRILPGDPLVAIFGPEGFTKLSEAERAHYMAELGLSDPLVVQYLSWVGDIARGNFGRSFFRSESVGEMILRRGPLTAEIGIMAVILSWLVGIPVAIVSALRPNSLGDNVSRFISIVFLAIPGFWLGMLIVLFLQPLSLQQTEAPEISAFSLIEDLVLASTDDDRQHALERRPAPG